MARLGGFLHSVESTRATSLESVARRLWHRMPWLLVGLIGAMGSAGLMKAFEAQLDANLAVAYFVPAIVYLADAVGTQTETLAIRGRSVGVGIRGITGREALTGLSVGVLLGVIMAPVVGADDRRLDARGRGCARRAGSEHDRHGCCVGAALAAESAGEGSRLRFRAPGHRHPGPAVDRDLLRCGHRAHQLICRWAAAAFEFRVGRWIPATNLGDVWPWEADGQPQDDSRESRSVVSHDGGRISGQR